MRLRRVLIADSDFRSLDNLASELTARGCEAFFATSDEELGSLVGTHAWDGIVVDLALPELDGLLAAQALAARFPNIPIVLTGSPGGLAERADDIRTAGFRAIQKPVNAGQLVCAIEQCTEASRLKNENKMLREQWEEREPPEDVASRDPQMVDALRQAATAADTSHPVAICGPPGTERDVVALYIHRCSARARRPFVRFECGHEIVLFEEAQLFGRSSLDAGGADSRTTGRFGVADGGTLFLDNIGELSMRCQAKLLRFIQEGQFLPAGESDGHLPPERADVRILTGHVCDARELLHDTRLRQDLLYRLNAFSVSIPTLRERRDDILPLAKRFVRRFAIETSKNTYGIDPVAERLLVEYDWPGNVDELRDCIRTAVTGAKRDVLLPEDLLRGPCRTEVSGVIGGVTGPTIEDAQRQLILKTLNETHGDCDEAARRLRIAVTVLTAKIERYKSGGLITAELARAGEPKKC